MPKLVLFLGISMVSFVLAQPALAQGTVPTTATPTQSVAAETQIPAGLNQPAVTSSGDYKNSLNSLATLYQNQVQRLEKQNATSKDLYKDGLISRVEMETSDKTLADARAKVEEVAKQIAEANKPTPIAVADSTSSIVLNNS